MVAMARLLALGLTVVSGIRTLGVREEDFEYGPPCGTDPSITADRRVVFFGGTFDPPTVAHAATSKAYLNVEGVDCVWIVVNNNPDYKKDKQEFSARVAMLELMRANGDFGDVDRVEISELTEDLPPSADWDGDTLELLRTTYPSTTKFDAAFGADTFTSTKIPFFPGWGDRFMKILCGGGGRVLVVSRAGADKTALEHKLGEISSVLSGEGMAFEHVPMEELPGLAHISSTEIRKALAKHDQVCTGDCDVDLQDAVDRGLPQVVAAYLDEHRELLQRYAGTAAADAAKKVAAAQNEVAMTQATQAVHVEPAGMQKQTVAATNGKAADRPPRPAPSAAALQEKGGKKRA